MGASSTPSFRVPAVLPDTLSFSAAVYFQLYLSTSLFIAIGSLAAITLRLAVSSTTLSPSATDLYWCIVYETIFVAISAVFQRAAVAIKYALMSQRDYQAVMTTEQVRGDQILG